MLCCTHLHHIARPARPAALPTCTAQLRRVFTLCAPAGALSFFAASRGTVESGTTASAQSLANFGVLIFIVAACPFSMLRVGCQLIGTCSRLTFRFRLIDRHLVRAQKHDLHACMPHCHHSACMPHGHISPSHYHFITADHMYTSSCMPSHTCMRHILNTSHHTHCPPVCCVQPIWRAWILGESGALEGPDERCGPRAFVCR